MTSTHHSNGQETTAPADAAKDNWVDRFAPAPTIPYLRLMRADRPIGAWLLGIPCLYGLGLAAAQGTEISVATLIYYALLCGIGAFIMRGAGCAYNDIVDKDFDAKVERTALRPIPSGQVTLRQAWIFLISLCFSGLIILLQFNIFAIGLGFGSLVLVAAYPFMKRITWWPQAWLGLTFNWGVLLGYAAISGKLSLSAFLVYAGSILWTLGYDTIYACQDKEDDALIGVKSSARALGTNVRQGVAMFYAGTVVLFMLAGVAGGFSPFYFVAFWRASGPISLGKYINLMLTTARFACSFLNQTGKRAYYCSRPFYWKPFFIALKSKELSIA